MLYTFFSMHFTNSIQKAIDVAARCHAKHERIGLGLPYIVHPYSVALITSEYLRDDDAFCAALLHDVLEDTDGYDERTMRVEFGDEITELVLALTEAKSGSDTIEVLRQNWEWRKRRYLDGLKKAPHKALIICAADSIHNLESLIQLKHLHGDTFVRSFGASMEKKMWFYGQVVETLREFLDSPITNRLEKVYGEARLAL